jgi:hypothetical protein
MWNSLVAMNGQFKSRVPNGFGHGLNGAGVLGRNGPNPLSALRAFAVKSFLFPAHENQNPTNTPGARKYQRLVLITCEFNSLC